MNSALESYSSIEPYRSRFILAARVLVVDDYAPWRDFIFEALEQVPDLEICAEAADGVEGVKMALDFQQI